MKPTPLAALALSAAAFAVVPATAAQAEPPVPGQYRIVSQVTNECIVLYGADIGSGPCGNGSEWTIEPVGGGSEEVLIRQGPTCVSDVVHEGFGEDLTPEPCDGDGAHRWTFVETDRGRKLVAENTKVAEVQPPLDYETTNFVRVVDDNGSPGEYWRLDFVE